MAATVGGGIPASVPGAFSDAIVSPLTKDLPHGLAASTDRGAIAGSAMLPHIKLALKRPAVLQSALDALALAQVTKGSTSYHKWLLPSQLRAYGPNQSDVNAVTAWMTRHGLTVNYVTPDGMTIDFAGTTAKVGAAFHTALHNVQRGSEAHVANVTAPMIPTALMPVVNGVTLANYFPKPALHKITPSFTVPLNPPYYAVAPADFATIYNINPLRKASTSFYPVPITGKGVTIAVVEQTTIKQADWNSFRSAFGLSGYAGTLSQTHPGNCASPGVTGDEVEAALDSEWSSAVAPDAQIREASCAGTPPLEFGVATALQNIVNYDTPPTILSISYGGDEIEDGFAFIAAWENLLEEASAEGKSVFVSSGDSGTSNSEGGYDSTGLFVNGLADTPYNVSVGGTDFYDAALGQTAKYWSATNGAYFSSALSYVPEIPWNNSCANPVISTLLGYPSPTALCNSAEAAALQEGVGGSGSQSLYFPKPSWQSTSIVGVPNDGVRDQPDVSLFAANGEFGHFYVYCMSDASEGGSPCNYSNVNDIFGNAAGGTSFAAPEFAGILALVAQTAGDQPLGNPAPALYSIAKSQFSIPLGLTNCNSTLGKNISTACAYQYVTAGSNAMPCVAGTLNCVTTSASTAGIGILDAKVAGKTVAAYPAQTGYSLATGLGTVNVQNFVVNYPL